MLFKQLDLHPDLLNAIARIGFTETTDIQREAIPAIIAGWDVMASAQTGTGKTAAFAVPTLQNLLTSPKIGAAGPRALVLTPTRELALQVRDCVDSFSRCTPLKTGLVVGGIGYGPQTRMLRKGVDLLVATPGRLKDHMEQGTIDFRNLEVLILDEADRMLDMGFIRDIRKITAELPVDRQTLLFSATLDGDVLKIARELMRNPKRISLTRNNVRHQSIDQRIHFVDSPEHKHRLLTDQLGDENLVQAVIFTRTKRGADRLARKLSNQDFKCAALHGNMSQGKRKRTIDQMRKGGVRFLVATDVASRGIDIDGISHVINFDMPMVAEDYIHRIGRTGRAGATGTAISLVNRDDRAKLREIERLTGRAFDPESGQAQEPGENRQTRRFPPRQTRKSFRGKGKGQGRTSNSAKSASRRQQKQSSRRTGFRAAA